MTIRSFTAFYFAALKHEFCYTAERPAISLRKTNRQQSFIFELNLAGTLHMQKKQIHRVGDPDKLQVFPPQYSINIDFPAAIVRDKLAALYPANLIFIGS